MNLARRIAGPARLLATGKLALSSGFDGAQVQRRLMAWRAGGESINSPGGSVFEGVAIYNALKRHDARVTVCRPILQARIGLTEVRPGPSRRWISSSPAR